MPLPHEPSASVELVPAHRYALVRLHGRCQGAEVVEAGTRAVGHPDWRPGFTEVWDLTDAVVDFRPSDLRLLMEAERAHRDALAGSRTIVITARPGVRQGLKLFAHLIKPFGRGLDVAATRAQAADLLGVDALASSHRPAGPS